MRIAIATWSDRRAGGVETYIESVAAALGALGHEVALWHEASLPEGRAPIAVPPGVAKARLDGSLPEWKPDVVLLNGLHDAGSEARIIAAVPTVVVAHNPNHTCISGLKTWAFPVAQPCHRRLGWPCLLHYFPHRCGGLSPATMVRLYTRKQALLAINARAQALVTYSAFMRDEYLRHGFEPDRVHHIPYGPGGGDSGPAIADGGHAGAGGTRRLITIFRFERMKGGHLVLDALAPVADALATRVELTMVGDGPERDRLERQAARLAGDRVAVRFAGWMSPEQRDAAIRRSHLLVVPSIYPEALGIVGLEAARLGVPAAAFDAGAVGEWLLDGRTGVLATASPPSAAGLAAAIVACLRDEARRVQLGDAARRHAATVSPTTHARRLVEVLEGVAGLQSVTA